MLKAVIYDFDGTLTPNTLPEFAILERCSMENGTGNPRFMPMIKEKMQAAQVDVVRATILTILDVIKAAGLPLTDENICLGADAREFNLGVPEFLSKLQEAGVKNYILSSGSKAYLARTAIAPYCTEIFGSTLRYDQNGEAIDLDLVVTPEEKAAILQKLAQELNGAADDCSGMVYVGDGPTDADAMAYIKAHGGKAILVYRDPNSEDVEVMREQGVVDLFAPADYRAGGELAKYIDKLIAADDKPAA